MTLFTPINDVSHEPYCGPTAIGLLTGVPLGRIERMIQRRRRSNRAAPVKAIFTSEAVRVLRTLGCKVTELRNPEPMLGRFVRHTAEINASFLVFVSGHFVVTYKGKFGESIFWKPTRASHHDRRRVVRAWRIKAPATPRYND